MNLHEECLLKYLINPLELFYTTELLKNNNEILGAKFENMDCCAKHVEIAYQKA